MYQGDQRPIANLPSNYREALKRLDGRQSRKVANNTYLHLYGASIGLRLHATDVIVYHEDGRIAYNSGGYRTVTTQQRINSVLKHHGYRVHSNGARKSWNRFWVISDFTGEESTDRFFDGDYVRERPVEWNGSEWTVERSESISVEVSDPLAFIMAFEGGELSSDEIVEGFQGLIDSGLAWQLQGSYGRSAQALIDAGHCHA